MPMASTFTSIWEIFSSACFISYTRRGTSHTKRPQSITGSLEKRWISLICSLPSARVPSMARPLEAPKSKPKRFNVFMVPLLIVKSLCTELQNIILRSL